MWRFGTPQTECAPSSGLCGAIPEASALHFLTDAPRGQQLQSFNGSLPPLASYYVNREDVMTYADAVQYCASSSYMGADWEVVKVQVRGWVKRTGMRQRTRVAKTVYVNDEHDLPNTHLTSVLAVHRPHLLLTQHTGRIQLGCQRLDSKGRARGRFGPG